jgi:hypothetical protein
MSEYSVKEETVFVGRTEDSETIERKTFYVEYDANDCEVIKTKDGGYIFRRKKDKPIKMEPCSTHGE